MTAAKVMDIISRLPGCDGQAADAVSAYTQVKMEDAPKLLKNYKIGMSRHLDSSTTTTGWPKSWSSMEDPVVPLERNLYGHSLAGLLWERQFEKILLKYGWEKVSNWECFSSTAKKGLFLSVYVDNTKLAGKKQNIDPMWKALNKEFDLGEPTSFLDHVYVGCSQRQCEISKDMVDNQWTMCESRISAGENWKTTMLGKSSCFFVVLRYGRSCQEMCGTILWVGKQDDSTTPQSIYSMHWWSSFQRRRLKSVGELSKVSSQIVLKCLYLARIGRPIFHGQWTNLRGRLQNGQKFVTNAWIYWSLTSITHVNPNNIVMWEILLSNADWDCFRTLILREILKTQNQLRVEHCAFLEAIHLFQPAGCVRNKLQFHTVQQNQKSSLWMQDWGEMVLLLLIYGIWSFQCLEARIWTV